MKIKSLLTKTKIGVCMALMSFLLNSCDTFHDDINGCGLYLRFKYDYNMKKMDLFAEHIKQVDVFFFDPNGILKKHLSAEGGVLSNPNYRMDITSLPRSNYQVITWAGLSDDYQLEYNEGETHLSDFKLQLLYVKKLKDGIYLHSHSDLWYGDVSIDKNDWTNLTKEVNLIKNTNYFHISLGSDNVTFNKNQLSEYTFHLTTDNGEYDYKNDPTTETELIYGPYDYVEYGLSDSENGKWLANINTMRILENQPANLVIRSKNNQVVANVDLMYYIKEGIYQSEGQGMSFAEYLDRQDHFYIHFEISNYIVVSITINGWTTWLHNTDL